jgi:hypothetical protein
MAPSTLEADNAGWGVFTLKDRPHGRPLLYGDIVVQITDLNMTHVHALKRLLHEYLWSSEETGGFYEGRAVISSIPGIGMLANGLPASNILSSVAQVDEAGLTRKSSPGAGAISYYHNYTYYVQKPLQAGEEVFLHYGDNWIQERQSKWGHKLIETPLQTTRPLTWLRSHGYCLDNIKPGTSRIPDAGRGAFATRPLPKGSIVAPVPVVPILDRRVMDFTRQRQDGSLVSLQQLLLNYCLGHPLSSVLLYPYAPGLPLINHDGLNPNVRLQWSSLQVANLITTNVSLADLHDQPKFLLELVAIRDIPKNQEIVLDYGTDWVNAWRAHVASWEPQQDNYYAPAYVMNDVVIALRIQEELKEHPYPDNIFTSCFYRYMDHAAGQQNNKPITKDAVTTVRWNQTRSIFELLNLRPCHVLKRQKDDKQGTLFTVQILNRYGLTKQERVPSIHIVTHVPRKAIRFSDKLYTTDQHMEIAFRHEVGVPNDVFPEQWKDLKME